MPLNTLIKKSMKTFVISFVLFISVIGLSPLFAQEVGYYDLKCEHLTNPVGIDASHPRFTWKMQDNRNGAKQTTYRVLVGTDSLSVAQGNADYWDTGEVAAVANIVTYQGEELRPFTRYFWKIEGKDGEGQLRQGPVAAFETGMMEKSNWKGAWISDRNSIDHRPAPYFRKEFSSEKKIKSARVYMAAAGLYELYINGEQVGEERLNPMYTRFDRRILYVTHDVTDYLGQGANAIGVILGNGWYNHQPLAVWDFDRAPWRNRPAFCMDLRITYEDGSVETILSERDWKTSGGEIVSNNIYTAEHYDGRMKQIGWNTVGFDDGEWQHVAYRSAPSDLIAAQSLHPIRNVQEIRPKTITKLNDSTYLYDLERNISGVTKLTVTGEKGTTLRLKHGERLHEDGRVDMSNIDVYYRPKDDTDPFQTDIVTLNGDIDETFMPKFNYKGFRYVEVTTDRPLALDLENLVGYFMYSDVPPIGQIHASDSLINKIAWANNNSYLSNLFGYPTDCPQREKNGWTGDGHFAIETALYNFDGITVYEKWLDDHRDEQQPNGVLPDIIPTGGWGYGTANGTDWTSTIAIIPWNLYLFYGDTKPLSDNYEAIKRYVDYVTQISTDGLTSWGRGDWVPVKTTSSLELTSSIYYYVDADILAKTAKLLGKEEDATHYSQLATYIKEAINSKYLNAETGIYADGTQTELSMPLMWGVVPEDQVEMVARQLFERVKADGSHIDVGVLGAKAILNALSENGYPEMAYTLASRDTYPSWGAWIAAGATTFLENWDLNATRDISDNHMMFGEIGAWFFKCLGGIKPDENHPGFKHVFIQPHFTNELDHFEASFNGPYGEIKSNWHRNDRAVVLEVTIPPSSSGTVVLPDGTRQTLAAGLHQLKWQE